MSTLTYRDFVDKAIIFGCIPALVLSIIFWFIAIAFVQARSLAMIMTLLITLLLSCIGIILLMHYANAAINSVKMYSADPTARDSEKLLMLTIWRFVLCVFLAIYIYICLSMISTLGNKHFSLLVTEVLLIGYQTWRVLRRHHWRIFWKRQS